MFRHGRRLKPVLVVFVYQIDKKPLQLKMADPLPGDRLLRKRNRSLQKQLDVTLQILGEEYRQCKERMYKEERDCGKFLQSLYNTVPDLQCYGPPNTRVMNATAILKERLGGGGPENGGDEAVSESSSYNSPNTRPKSVRGKNRTSTSSVGSGSTGKANGLNGRPNSALPARQPPAKNTGSMKRPNTACIQRPQNSGHQNQSKRSSTSFAHRKSLGSQFGKGAYSEHERFVQDMVLKKFQVIFDPDTEARKFKVSTTATPIVMMQNHTDEGDKIMSNGHSGVVGDLANQDAGNEEDNEGDRRHQPPKRVVWSARPHRKYGTVSAPDMALLDHSAQEAEDTPVSSRLRSSSMTLPNRRPKSENLHIQCSTSCNPAPVDLKIQALKIQALAHQRYPYSSNHHNQHLPENHTHTESNGQASKKQSSCHHQNFSEPHQHKPGGHTRRSSAQQHQADSHHNGKTPTTGHPVEHSKHHINNIAASAGVASHGTPRRCSTPQGGGTNRRMSDASEIHPPPEQLVAKLMNAGNRPGCGTRRPKTAPSKSELSHRFIPISRQTVVGILAQIENQKASTRNMINASKELQQTVKKLVPWEQSPDSDSDDW